MKAYELQQEYISFSNFDEGFDDKSDYDYEDEFLNWKLIIELWWNGSG